MTRNADIGLFTEPSKGGRIAIAFGRDAADVAIYTQFGDPVELLNMNVQVQRMSGPTY
jgi:hypothetical protein